MAENLGEVLYCNQTLAELQEVLSRKKFASYITAEDVQLFMERAASLWRPVMVREILPICRDPKDDIFLALAKAGKATHLVTGDADLLSLKQYEKTHILSAQDFSAQLTS